MRKLVYIGLAITTLLTSCSDDIEDTPDNTQSIVGSWNLDFTINYEVDSLGQPSGTTQTNYSTEPGINNLGSIWIFDSDSLNRVNYENGESSLNQPEDGAYNYSNNSLDLYFPSGEVNYDVITLSEDSLVIIMGSQEQIKKQFFRI